jgi:cardiolipin synthase
MLSSSTLQSTRWKFYLNSEDTWRATKEACLNAHKSIDIEQYIFEKDSVGSELIEILMERRKAGVRVRILCDMVGSYSLYSSDVPQILMESGIELRFFNVIKPWRIHNFFSFFFRDHRKLMVVDGIVGFVGGVGFSSEFRLWRDTHLKVIGPITKEIQYAFEEMWNTANQKSFFKRLKKAKTFVKGFQFITHSPYLGKRFLYQELITAIRNAHHSVYLTTPYFIPDRRLRRVLRLAAKRGVEVMILTPKISNHIWADYSSHSYYKKLLSSGVKIFQYTGLMLHSKTAVIDHEWATVGSFNLDSLSILYNYEANIVSTKKDFADEVRKYFLEDLEFAEEVHFDSWKNRSTGEKIREILTLPIRRFL